MVKLTAIRIVAIYVFVGALWIMLSDMILAVVTPTPSLSTLISITKGFGYVTVTALVLYLLIHRYTSDKKKAGAALRESEAKFRALTEASPTSIFIVQDHRFVYLNPAFEAMTRYTLAEAMGLQAADLIDPKLRAAFLEHLTSGSADDNSFERFETRLITRDNRARWVYYTGTRIIFNGKPAVLGNVIDITERKLADDQIRASLAEKDVLLKEIHHRVKNNLQIVSSLLSLQSSSISDAGTLQRFRESQNRIRSMALIHEELYKSGNLSAIDLADYLTNMVSYLYKSYVAAPDKVRLELAIDNISLKMDSAIPCGLIVNELVTNAFKHAFPGDRTGKVSIRLSADAESNIHLSIADDGVGLPSGLDVRETTTLGLQLVNSLVDQLDGSLSFDLQNGTAFHVVFREQK